MGELVAAVAGHEPLGVEEEAVLEGVLAFNAFGDHGVDEEFGDAGGGFAGAEEEEALIGKLLLRDAKSGVDARDGHGSRALDVVIEAEDLVLVAFEKVEGVVVAEVLELDEDVGPAAAGFGDEFLDEFVVGFARHAFLTQAEVHRIVQVFRVVRADVDGDGKRLFRGDAGAGRVERELAAGDAHAVDTEVAEAENALAVGHDDDVDFLVRAVFNDFADAALVVDRDEGAARIAVDMAELLADLADGRGVDHGHVVVDVVDQDLEVEVFVSRMQAVEHQKLVESRRAAVEQSERALDLQLHGGNGRRQKTAKAAGVALLLSEGVGTVELRVTEQVGAANLLGFSHKSFLLKNSTGYEIVRAVIRY